MEESVQEARKKAEAFLFKIVELTSVYITNEEKDIFYPKWNSEIPLRFEAHAYICHKKGRLNKRYVEELRGLWFHWKKHEIGPKHDEGECNAFFPYKHYYCVKDHIYEKTGQPIDTIDGSEIESHVSMLRAKEILGIPGFHNDFNLVINNLKEYFINFSFEYFSAYLNQWLVFRSKTVQDALKRYVQNAAFIVLDVMQNHKLVKYKNERCSLYEFDSWLSGIIFLVLSCSKKEYLDFAKIATEMLIDYPEANGSISNDITATCSFLISLYLTKVDPLRIIQNKALEWLISKQDESGSWNHLKTTEVGIPDWDILSTVIVLETIDLITNNKPLPPWIPIEKVEDVKIKRPSRVRDVQPLDIHPDIKWKNVNISFSSPKSVRILAGNVIQQDFRSMGFMNENTEEPDILWATLLLFAIHLEGISWKTKGIPLKISKNLKTNKKDLGNRLKWLFQTDEKPFENYRKLNLYKPKFDIFIGGDFNKEEYLKLIDEIVCSKY